LIDYFGAQKDMKEKVLRVLHNLSFVEDPTRVLRAIRFEQRFGFKIGKLTLALIKNAVKLGCFKDADNRRLFLELGLVLKEQDPGMAIKRMDELNLFRFVSPGFLPAESFEQLFEEIKKVIVWYNLLYLEEPIENWKVYWHGFTSSFDSKALKALAEKMGMLNLDGRRMVSQRESIDVLIDNIFKFEGDNYQLYTLLSPYDTELLLYLMAKAHSEKIRRLISTYFTKLKGTEIRLGGRELAEMGFQPGPIFREIFNGLMEARLNNLIKSREDEIRFVEKNWKSNNRTTSKRMKKDEGTEIGAATHEGKKDS
ncbi:MAG: CCA tRNA nucleotidyltransferase, partial [Desulfobacterales bacterium]|nr:CCA tRNA nucleotidyltransferase [Desulfobacterales bacterium]